MTARAGDCLIAALARRMQDMLLAEDYVARYAGEEFALVVRRPSAQAVRALADAVRAAVAGADLRMRDLLEPAARYPAGEMPLPASPANEAFRRGLRGLKAGQPGPAAEAFRSALALDAQHVPSIMELAYLQLRQTLSPARLDETFRVTLSRGVAWYQAGDTPQTLIERADAGLGRAKRTGRNQVVLAHDERQK